MTATLGYSATASTVNVDLDVIGPAALNADANADLALDAYPQTDGRTVASLSAYLANNAVFNVLDYGADRAGVVDSTSAFNATCAAAGAVRRGAVHIPGGDYLITAPVTIGSGVVVVGDGMHRTRIIHTPTANGICLRVTNGASQAINNVIAGISIYSEDDTYTKCALELSDVSSCVVRELYIYGTGTGSGLTNNYYSGGTGSTGICTKGREVSSFSELRIVADKPVNIAANPNTAATDGSDADHFHFFDCYLLANGFYIVTVDDGLGVQHLTIDGYQAWVDGVGGFTMNDTRVAPTVPSRNVTIRNIRREQGTDVNGYGINITCVDTATFDVLLDNLFIDFNEQGVFIDGYRAVNLRGVICATAAGKDALNIVNPHAAGTLHKAACLESPGSVITLTGLNNVAIWAHETGTSEGPSDAFYAQTRAATRITVAGPIQAASGAAVTSIIAGGGSGADRIDMVGNATGSGGRLRAMNAGGTDFEPMQLAFENLDLLYRTGVGTTASAGSIATTGMLSLTKRLLPAQDTGAAQTAGGFYGGTGVPNNANGANGDIYFRFDGTAAANTMIYHREGGAWVALTTS